MDKIQNPIDRQSAAENLIAKYVNRDVDLIEVERMYNDMVLRYFHPADGWNPNEKLRSDALYSAEIITTLLREVWEGRVEMKEGAMISCAFFHIV
jgi:hypothetical protein